VRIFRLLLVLWAGSLWSSIWVALSVFQLQPDRHLAGLIAARLFGIETYLGLAVMLIAALRDERRRFLLGYLAAALLTCNEWFLKHFMDQALAAGSALGLGFGAWHAVSALVYLAACGLLAAQLYPGLPQT
jgi:hypothetical protein